MKLPQSQPKRSLTPALSHRMGEGESFAAAVEGRQSEIARRSCIIPGTTVCCSLSHRMGEGQGEGYCRATAAFTMIEIAISLAVIAFALVAIIGVLPSGLTVQRENREETIINQDASVFVSAIRNGERGFDDLTNYVYAITNWWTTWDLVNNNIPILTNNPVSGFDGYGQVRSETHSITLPVPGLPLTNGLRIVGLMSRPKYEVFPNQLRSNHIVAYVRAMSGLATEKPPQTNSDVRADAFAYRLICENQQTQAYVDPVPLPAGQVDYARQLLNNLRELRLTFRWPLNSSGQTGNGRQTFRMAVGGELQQTSDPYVAHPLWLFHPTTFVKAP